MQEKGLFSWNRSPAIFAIPKAASTQDMKFIIVAFHLLEIRMWQLLNQNKYVLTEKLCLPTFSSHKLQSQKVKQTVLALQSATANDFMSSLLILTLGLPTSRSLITDLIFGWCVLVSAVYPNPWRVMVIPSQKAANAGFLSWKWRRHSWTLRRRYKQEPKWSSLKKPQPWARTCKGLI